MMSAQILAASFRDPSGHVYRRDGKLYRTIARRASEDFARAEETGFLEKLVSEGRLVAYRDVDPMLLDLAEKNIARALEIDPLPFISYPYEWSFAGLRAAALAHLNIQISGLDHNVVLSDASAYNIQFNGSKPIFIDHLSFRPYREGEFWAGHRQFCEQFLNPLLLRARLDIPHNAWYRGNLEGIPSRALASILPHRDVLKWGVLTNVFMPVWLERQRRSNSEVSEKIKGRRLPKQGYLGLLRSLHSLISRLEPSDGVTVWSDYADNTSYATAEAEGKRAFVAAFTKGAQPETLWDIGCNTGDFTEAVLGAGGQSVVGFEFDTGALEIAFKRASAKQLAFLPLYMDVANPTPSQGWNQKERDGLYERQRPDALLALAVVHHLSIGRNVPLPMVTDWLIGIAPKGVIEFVPKRDPMVQELLRLREDIFDDYNEASFEAAVRARARIVETKIVTESGRQLVWYDRS